MGVTTKPPLPLPPNPSLKRGLEGLERKEIADHTGTFLSTPNL